MNHKIKRIYIFYGVPLKCYEPLMLFLDFAQKKKTLWKDQVTNDA